MADAVINRLKPKTNRAYRCRDYGYHMSQLSKTQRQFVEQLFENPHLPKYKVLQLAGYKSKGMQDEEHQKTAAKQMVQLIMRNQLVLDAIKEHGAKVYSGKLPQVVHALDKVMHDPKHKDHVKVLHDMLDRVGMPTVKKQETTVIHTFNRDSAIARIAAILERNPALLPVTKALSAPVQDGDTILAGVVEAGDAAD